MHVLIVDDEPSVLGVCRYYLEHSELLTPASEALVIHQAASGEEALTALQELTERGERLACAMVDMILPDGCDGIETIERLWAVDPDIQVTLITGEGHLVEDRIDGRIPGEFLDRWDYLAKPFSEFQFVQRTRRALAAWGAHRKEEHRSGENLTLLMKLATSNRELEETVRERTRDLALRAAEQEKKNHELEAAVRELEAAQSRLLQQEKLASIGQLAAGVAHELNNPIGFVHSNLGTLQRYCEKIRTLVDAYEERVEGDDELGAMKKELKIEFVLEDLPALVEESLEGTERVRKIVSDLKGFSHPSEHEARFADLNAGLRSTLNIVHNEIKYKATVLFDLGEIPEVRCVPGQINQVLMNLLVNAAQAIDDQGEIS
ncbi:MAG: response regulator, partial [Planctomycetota bacterium]|nr:response regulator [Planctomycetota bacterium]